VRLIRHHDSGHRLDGFLKITQAAQTDALVRVLDDNLARFLGRLLDEVQDEAQKEAPGAIQRSPARTVEVQAAASGLSGRLSRVPIEPRRTGAPPFG